jgi:uncharacterized protein
MNRDTDRVVNVLYLTASAGVICVPEDVWYVVHYPQGHGPDVYLDVVTPPVWSEAGASMVDLDLDVVLSDGDVRVVDEDEFERNRVEYSYPPELVAAAREAAAEIVHRTVRGEPPFVPGVASHWHDVRAAHQSQRH